MNLFAAVMIFCAMPLMLVLLARVVTVRSRGDRQPRTSPLGMVVSVAILLLLPAFWISRQGAPIQGILIDKSDLLTVSDTGLAPSTSRRFMLTIADPSAQGKFAHWPVRADLQLEVDEARFDSLQKGQHLAMHEWTMGPLKVARLDSMPWWILAPGLLDRVAHAIGWDHQFGGQLMDAQATLISVRTVREADPWSPFGRAPRSTVHVALKQPYDEMRLQLRARNGEDAVALDRIDSGSAGTLTQGLPVSVIYPVDHPRLARLATGTRYYGLRNAINYWGFQCIFGLVGALVLSVVYGVRRRGVRGSRPDA